MASKVNHPTHYGGEDNPYEVVKVAEAWGFDKDAYLFNVLKYIARAGKKDKVKLVEDYEKAKWYLERKIKRLRDNYKKLPDFLKKPPLIDGGSSIESFGDKKKKR